jgi:L-ascorbate metabolism protein UlaG (beta-lactamase superfamily)
MDNQPKYLKPNVVIEPLFDRWYAWSHLISPFTSAMNVVGRHLKIMDSYILAPHIHAAAVKNPKMLGGPFMDYKINRVDEIKKLKEQIVKNQKDNIELVAAIKALDKMLKENAKGYSLEPLYKLVPDLLKGYIELVYDLNGHPSFRVIEPLAYKSEYFKPASQSIALWLTENDSRPFVLSTPRLDEKNVVHVNIPFDHEGIDELARMKRTPNTIEYIRNLLKVDEKDFETFDSFFTSSPMASYKKYDGDKIRMRYFGHACIFIETKEVSILVDPLISYYGYQSDVSRFSDLDLPDTLDYILITHNHQDHILFETLLPLRHKTKNIIVPRSGGGAMQDPSLKLMFEAIGFENVIEIDEMEVLEFANCKITGIPFTGEHSDLNIKAKTCHHVKIGQFSILFVADSRVLEPKLYEHVHKEIGKIDVIFLGMECDGAPLTWLYGPLLSEELGKDKDITRRLSGSNYERGISLVDIFNPKEVYVYAMGQEPWVEFISSVRYTDESNPIVESNKLIKECTERGIIAERLFGEKELLYNYELVEEFEV